METIFFVVALFAGCILGIVLAYLWLRMEHQRNLHDLAERYAGLIKGSRQDAVTRSKSSLLGRLWEQTAPFLPGFPYRPNDMRFMGAPIDYIVFDGLSDGNLKKIVFLEVKSSKSKLSEQEKKLKNAVDSGRVAWEEFRIDGAGKLDFKDEISDDELNENLRKAGSEL